jgi:uncharacterized protein (DUF2249 family)
MCEPTIIDIRRNVPQMRYATIFGLYRHLAPGEHFHLVSDHDPREVFYQFEFEGPGGF